LVGPLSRISFKHCDRFVLYVHNRQHLVVGPPISSQRTGMIRRLRDSPARRVLVRMHPASFLMPQTRVHCRWAAHSALTKSTVRQPAEHGLGIRTFRWLPAIRVAVSRCVKHHEFERA
jgi:hypothetical protein